MDCSEESNLKLLTVTKKLSGQSGLISSGNVNVVVDVWGPTMTNVLKSSRKVQMSEIGQQILMKSIGNLFLMNSKLQLEWETFVSWPLKSI